MACRAIVGALAVAATLTLAGPAPAQQTPAQSLNDELELRFVRGLRELGYFDLASDYIDGLLKDPKTPESLRPVLNYEIGRGLLEEATRSADLERRYALLEQARAKLDGFVKAFPNDPITPEAQVQLARLYVERGHTAMLQSQEEEADAAKEAKLASARAAFDEARKAYAAAEGPIQKLYESFPKFIPEGDPRREARDRAHIALMEDQLQRAIVDYEEAQTYPAGGDQRTALLDKSLTSFEEIFNRYRTTPAGLYARMLQGKSYEEKGELGPAMGIYNELMEHNAPELRDLQRRVGFYRIIVIGKRKEHALAVDEAARWLQANPNHRISEIGLGVQLELARNLIALLPEMNEKEKEDALRNAGERLNQVVRYYSPYKPEALDLLKTYLPRDARHANQIANLSYDDAMSQADTAISTQDWELAASLLNQATRRALRSREIEKANRARYFLSFTYYSEGQYYRSVALAEHLARRYKEFSLSPKAAEIGLAALTMAYNTYKEVDRVGDLNHLVEFAVYLAETWPDTDQADLARVTLGEVAMGRGEYEEAARWLESVRPDSSRRLDAQVKAGDAHWRHAQRLREEGQAGEADSEVKAAFDLIADALKKRDEAGTSLTDPGRITNANALAEIHRASGRPTEGVSLLEPIAKAMQQSAPAPTLVPLYAATLSILVRSQLAAGQADQAVATMKVLESVSPSKTALTQLYYELGRSLKSEMDALEAKGDLNAYRRTQEAYRKFLTALAGSQAGQSYDSLQWAGESMLDLKMPAEAAGVFRRVLETYEKDSQFNKDAQAVTRLLRTRLKLAAALRDQGQFDEARGLIRPIAEANPSLLDPWVEKGLLLEAEARTRSSKAAWEASLSHWKTLALKLRNARKKPPEYYDAWYHVAVALFNLGNKAEAASTLKGVMTLSPSVGTPEMKSKYNDFLARISK